MGGNVRVLRGVGGLIAKDFDVLLRTRRHENQIDLVTYQRGVRCAASIFSELYIRRHLVM